MDFDISFLKEKPIRKLMILLIVQGLASSIMSPVHSLYINSFGIAIFSIGIIASTAGFVRIFIDPPAGSLCDKIGRKWLITFSLFAISIIQYMYLNVNNFAGFLILGIFGGFFNSILWVSIWTYMADVLEKTGKEYALVSLIWAAPGIIGPYIGGLIGVINYRLNYIISATILLCLSFYTLSFSETKDGDKKNFKDGIKLVLDGLYIKEIKSFMHAKRNVFLTSFMALVMSFDASILYTFLPLYLKGNYGLSALWIGIVLASLTLIQVIVRTNEFMFYKKIPSKKTMLFGLFFSGVFYVLIPFAKDAGLFIFLILAQAFASYFIYPLMFEALRKALPRRKRGELMGMHQTFKDMGSISGNMGGGAISQTFSIPAAFAISGLLYLTSFTLSTRLEEA